MERADQVPTRIQEHIEKMASYCAIHAGDGLFAERSREVYDYLRDNAASELMLVSRRTQV